MNSHIEHLNPDGLMKNPAFSQIVVTKGSGKTIYIGGQNAINAEREIVGKGNLQLQTEQVMKNIQIALAACDATFDDVVKLNIHIVQNQNAYEAFKVAQKFISNSNPPAITVLSVSGLANTDFLIEIDAIAFAGDK
jgi:enamine deaminase RidA (YjgF/YER057c/UK114 family)